MAEFIEPGPICDTAGIREAVCIHTRKIFDSCREKDISSLRYSNHSIITLLMQKLNPRQQARKGPVAGGFFLTELVQYFLVQLPRRSSVISPCSERP